jgi:hypothetical protein
MRRFSRREQILIGLCALVLLAAGLPALWDAVAGGGLSPEAARARLRTARRERVAHATALGRLEQVMGQVVERRPAAALPAAVMSALDQRARAHRIALREVRPLPERPLDGAVGVPVQFSFTAPFPRAARFLAGLRAQPGGLAVERVVIATAGSGPSASAGSDQVTVQARVLAFSAAPSRREGRRG